MILVFDIGTTVLKGGIINETGSLLAYYRLPFESPLKNNTQETESAPVTLIKTFIMVSQKLIREIKKTEINSVIRGTVISGNGPSLVPVDVYGEPVSGIISWTDRKSLEYVKDLKKICNKEVDPSFYLSKVYSLFVNQPLLYRKVRWFLPCPEFFSFFLTGISCAILPSKGYEKLMWTDNILHNIGLDNKKFPPFINSGEEIGKVTVIASEKTGIPRGIPVFAGGPDFTMSLLGTGTVTSGRICDRTGTSEGVNFCSDKTVLNRKLSVIPHIIPGLYNISSILPFAGKITDWFFRLLEKDSIDYKKYYNTLSHIFPGKGRLLFLPHITYSQNSLWNPYRSGVILGLAPDHTNEHIFKAIIEGLGYAAREIFELFEQAGLESKDVRISGIQSSYKAWNQLRADIIGKKILVPKIKDTELTGCACVGLVALGCFDNFHQASDNLVCIEREYEPDQKNHTMYNEIFCLYKDAYKKTDHLLQALF